MNFASAAQSEQLNHVFSNYANCNHRHNNNNNNNNNKKNDSGCKAPKQRKNATRNGNNDWTLNCAPQKEMHKFSNKVAVDVETAATTTIITTVQG